PARAGPAPCRLDRLQPEAPARTAGLFQPRDGCALRVVNTVLYGSSERMAPRREKACRKRSAALKAGPAPKAPRLTRSGHSSHGARRSSGIMLRIAGGQRRSCRGAEARSAEL